MLVFFRYINVFYGEMLEGSFETYGDSLEAEDNETYNNRILNQSGMKGKFNRYNRPITTLNNYWIKVIPYLLSWLIKVGKLIYLERKKKSKKKKIGKAAFYFIYVHNNIHFSIFNVFASSGIILVTRTLIHMKLSPETLFLKFDKIIAVFCLIFCLVDFLELFFTAIEYLSKKSKFKK